MVKTIYDANYTIMVSVEMPWNCSEVIWQTESNLYATTIVNIDTVQYGVPQGSVLGPFLLMILLIHPIFCHYLCWWMMIPILFC